VSQSRITKNFTTQSINNSWRLIVTVRPLPAISETLPIRSISGVNMACQCRHNKSPS
jgi:hypothetical protein